MSSNIRNLRAQREQELDALIAAQDPVVRDFSHELLSVPHIRESVFFGFALQWPLTYIAYLMGMLSAANQLPPALQSWAPEPHAELQDQLTHFRTSAQIHLDRLPDSHRPMIPAVDPAHFVELQTEILMNLRALVLGILYAHRHEMFFRIIDNDINAWLIFASDLANHTETELWTMPVDTALDVTLLRDDHARMVLSGALPGPVDVLIMGMYEAYLDVNQLNLDDDIAMDYDVLALDLMPDDDESQPEFPGFSGANDDEITAVPEDEQVFDFETQCVWYSATLLQPGEDAAEHPDREPLRTLPCSHVVGAFYFDVAAKAKYPMCSANV